MLNLSSTVAYKHLQESSLLRRLIIVPSYLVLHRLLSHVSNMYHTSLQNRMLKLNKGVPNFINLADHS